MRNTNRLRVGVIVGAIGVGAGLMYFVDPERGRRRRARAVQWASGTSRRADRLFLQSWHDLSNRTAGVVAELQARWRNETISDQKLESRVRARLGRVTSHPHSIVVTAHDGNIRLEGPILQRELEPLLHEVSRTRGVRAVENHLVAHRTASHVPGLQGDSRRWHPRWEMTTRLPTPAERTGELVVGSLAVAVGVRRPWPWGWVAAAAGLGLLSYGARRAAPIKLSPALSRWGGVDIRKSWQIHCPIERVYDFWATAENLPRFLSHVRRVEIEEGERSHWTLGGRRGDLLSFTALTTERVPHRRIAWRTLPGSEIRHSGSLSFEPWEGGTRLQLRLHYPGTSTSLRHKLVAILGSDPEKEIHDDLMRMKHFLETEGHASTSHPVSDRSQTSI